MKKIVFYIFLLHFISVLNANGLYYRCLGGLSYLSVNERHIHMHSRPLGYYLGASFGYEVLDFLDYEVEITYRNHPGAHVSIHHAFESPFKKGSRYAFSYMFNLICKYKGYEIIPFTGFGFGYTQARGKLQWSHQDSDLDKDDYPLQPRSNYTAQVLLGGSYPLTCRTELALEGRYLHEIASRYRFEFLNTRNISIGLSLKNRF